jgi:hypothetical protein
MVAEDRRLKAGQLNIKNRLDLAFDINNAQGIFKMTVA